MNHLETLDQFHQRVDGFMQHSLNVSCAMETNPNLKMKVDSDGKFLPFYGNTVVFDLPVEIKNELEKIQSMLYEFCGDFLAEPLAPDSFHITLHDLLSNVSYSELKEMEPSAKRLAMSLALKDEKIRMTSTYLFNMVNTSMVIGFSPADEESCDRVMFYYDLFQSVVPLAYPLTPHVTLAYYRPQMLETEQVQRLQTVIDEVSKRNKMTFELSSSMLKYQRFSDMNHYQTRD